MTRTETQSTPLGHAVAGGVHRLLVVHSPAKLDLGASRTLSAQPIVIGRDPEASPSLPLRQAQVSRRHAVIEPSESRLGFVVRDLDSRNGTYVNGRPITSAELVDGDVLRIGSTLILFQYLDAATCELLLDPHARATGTPRFGARLIGSSHAMLRLRESIRVAPTNTPVLVLGETGVGKERVAEALHEQSERSGPFVPVNCSALPSNLVESELFGHVRGAFTGAEARKGLYGRADKGTLFLDEIGDLALEVQAKFLRALAVGEVRPVGADQARTVDVRVVAATNVELEDAVARGSFRADLYARLMAHVIRVPPLRTRREDILELTRHFLRDAGQFEISADCAEALVTHDYPYNVRELEQILAPITPIVARRHVLELNDLPQRMRAAIEARATSTVVRDFTPSALLSVRRDVAPTADELRAVVASCAGNVAQVASFFGKDRRQIYRWAQALGVDIQGLRDDAQQRQTLPPEAAVPDGTAVQVLDDPLDRN